MYDEFRKEYEQAHGGKRQADSDDSRRALRASTYALLRVLDELRREDGPSAAGA
jgi:hypothetical protein